jgi:hypothetical protein
MSELDPNTAKVLLPIIRRVMPNIIANDIIGVQPMSSEDYIGSMIYEKGSVIMQKVHYQHFVRLPNRQKFHKFSEIVDKYKYTKVKVTSLQAKAAMQWCEQNLKPGAYIRLQNHFVFAYEADAVWFGMVNG